MRSCSTFCASFCLCSDIDTCSYIRGKPLAESKQAFASEKVAVKTAIALGRTLVLDMVLRNEDRLVCHTLGWRGNSGNLLVTEEVPHGLDQLGPPVLDSKQISGGSGFTRQRRTQSLAALSTSSNTDILVQLPKMHRSPSPELSHAGTAQSHALQVSFFLFSCSPCESDISLSMAVWVPFANALDATIRFIILECKQFSNSQFPFLQLWVSLTTLLIKCPLRTCWFQKSLRPWHQRWAS